MNATDTCALRKSSTTTRTRAQCVQPMRMKHCVPASAMLPSMLTATNNLLQLTNAEDNIMNETFSLPAFYDPNKF